MKINSDYLFSGIMMTIAYLAYYTVVPDARNTYAILLIISRLGICWWLSKKSINWAVFAFIAPALALIFAAFDKKPERKAN